MLTLLVEEGVVGGDGLRHVALELGVHGVANVQVVLGQQEAGAVVTCGCGGDECRVPGGVGVVDAGVRHPLVQDRKEDGDEVAHLPEELTEGHLGEEAQTRNRLHELTGSEETEEVVAAGCGVDALVVELPEGVHVAGDEGAESVHEALGERLTLRKVHAQCGGVAGFREGVAVDFQAQVQHLDPLDVLGHAVEVFVGGVLIPGDVNNAVGQIRVFADDIVHHRGHTTLEVGVGGFHDDGDVNVRVFGVAVVGAGSRKLQRRVVVSVHLFSHCRVYLSRTVRFLPGEGSTPEEGVLGCSPRLTVDAVACEGEHCLAHDDGQVAGLVGQDHEGDEEQHQVRCGEQLHGDVHGHVLDLVNQQCHCNEEERHDQAGERQRVGLRQEDEHQDAGDNSAGDVNQQGVTDSVVGGAQSLRGLLLNTLVGQAVEDGPQVLDACVDAVCLHHEEVVVGDNAGDQAQVDCHDVDFTAGDQEEHVLISPDDGAGEEAAQGVERNVLERDAREVQQVHQVLTEAHKQDERTNQRRQEPDDGIAVQGKSVAKPRDEPDDAVLREVRDDQQLRERNVENAQDEERTECSRAPVKNEGDRNCEEQHQRHGHEEEIEPVAGERGQVGNVLELRLGHACAYGSCFGTLELVLKGFSVNTQAFAGVRNLLVLHLDSTVKGQAGCLAEPRNGNGRRQNHLDQGYTIKVVPVNGRGDHGEDGGQQRDRGNVKQKVNEEAPGGGGFFLGTVVGRQSCRLSVDNRKD